MILDEWRVQPDTDCGQFFCFLPHFIVSDLVQNLCDSIDDHDFELYRFIIGSLLLLFFFFERQIYIRKTLIFQLRTKYVKHRAYKLFCCTFLTPSHHVSNQPIAGSRGVSN